MSDERNKDLPIKNYFWKVSCSKYSLPIWPAINLLLQLLVEDSITPLERQLYFTTAHAHFKAGCPALALEVLSKLPNKVIDENGESSSKCYKLLILFCLFIFFK